MISSTLYFLTPIVSNGTQIAVNADRIWFFPPFHIFQSKYFVFWDQRNYSGLKVTNFWKMKWKMSRLRVILKISKSFRKKIIFFKLIFWGLSNPLIFTISHTHSHTPWLTGRYLFQKGRAFHRSFGFSKLVLYIKNI